MNTIDREKFGDFIAEREKKKILLKKTWLTSYLFLLRQLASGREASLIQTSPY